MHLLLPGFNRVDCYIWCATSSCLFFETRGECFLATVPDAGFPVLGGFLSFWLLLLLDANNFPRQSRSPTLALALDVPGIATSPDKDPVEGIFDLDHTVSL